MRGFPPAQPAPQAATPRRARPSAAGFTLLEMLIVLVILGLAAGLVLTRGPARSRGLEVRSAAAQVMGTLRLARSRAIALDRPVSVVVDVVQRSYRIDDAPARVLPPNLGIDIVATADQTLGARRGAIRFLPDGSSSGGRIELLDGGRKLQVGVDWLTGRVSFADAH